MPAKIEIGGRLATELLSDLLDAIAGDRAKDDWNGDVPETAEPLFELFANDEKPRSLALYLDSGDEFEFIEEFCRKHGLTFRRRTIDARDAEVENHCIVWLPGMDSPADYLCTRDGKPLVEIDTPEIDRAAIANYAALEVPGLEMRPTPMPSEVNTAALHRLLPPHVARQVIASTSTPEVRKILTVAAAHLPQAYYYDRLTREAFKGIEEKPYVGQFGVILYAPPEPGYEAPFPEGMPASVRDILIYARHGLGCSFVLFDPDGEVFDGFPVLGDQS